MVGAHLLLKGHDLPLWRAALFFSLAMLDLHPSLELFRNSGINTGDNGGLRGFHHNGTCMLLFSSTPAVSLLLH
jgi:hypothetical protein